MLSIPQGRRVTWTPDIACFTLVASQSLLKAPPTSHDPVPQAPRHVKPPIIQQCYQFPVAKSLWTPGIACFYFAPHHRASSKRHLKAITWSLKLHRMRKPQAIPQCCQFSITKGLWNPDTVCFCCAQYHKSSFKCHLRAITWFLKLHSSRKPVHRVRLWREKLRNTVDRKAREKRLRTSGYAGAKSMRLGSSGLRLRHAMAWWNGHESAKRIRCGSDVNSDPRNRHHHHGGALDDVGGFLPNPCFPPLATTLDSGSFTFPMSSHCVPTSVGPIVPWGSRYRLPVAQVLRFPISGS